MVKIAYSIFDYKNPDRVVRLVNRLQTEDDYFHIHIDPVVGKEKVNEWKKIIGEKCQQSNISVVSEFRCKYGSYGLIDANLSAMKYYENYDYDYFIDMSGDSYPLKPPEVIKRELGERNGGFMDFFEVPREGWFQGGLHRLNYRHYFIPTRKYPYVKSFKIPRLRRELPCGLKPYGGLGNRCLQKRHIQYILKFVDDNPSVTRFFKRVWGPGEMFYQTILLNSPLKATIFNQPTMYVDFLEGTAHPKTLTKSDMEALIKSGKFFARKFDSNVDGNVLDLIDQMFGINKK